MKNQLTLGSLFDGIGGFPLAAIRYGITPIWASEIIPEAIDITKRHFPNMMHLGDITNINGGKIPPVDIISFGSPCQDLSIAGKKAGLNGERSALFLEAIRIIDEMREKTNGVYPTFAIWENVPGAFSSNARRDFAAVLEAFTKTKIPMPKSGGWANSGMVRGSGIDISWTVYNAKYFGVPQRRRRIFLVADFRGKRSGEILFKQKSLQRYFETFGKKKKEAARASRKSSEMANCTRQEIVCMAHGQANAEVCDNLSPCLSCNHEQPIMVYPNVVGTLCASGAGTSRPSGRGSELDFYIAYGMDCKASPSSNGTSLAKECSITLKTVPAAAVLTKVYGICSYASNAMKSDNPNSGIYEATTARTLDSNGGNPACNQGGMVVCSNYSTSYVARRITPLEGERLQGYPDNWTLSGANSKEISDTKRYMMLGNSIAVPCAAYIIQGIKESLGGDK